jgi:hypothetical protein
MDYDAYLVFAHFPHDYSIIQTLNDAMQCIRVARTHARDQILFMGDTNTDFLEFQGFTAHALPAHPKPTCRDFDRHNSFQSWLSALRLTLIESIAMSGTPALYSAQGYTMITRAPAGVQNSTQSPSLLDMVASSRPSRTKVTAWWDGPADHAFVAARLKMPIITKRKVRVEMWRCSDVELFRRHLAAHKPAEFGDRTQLTGWLRTSSPNRLVKSTPGH